MFPFFIFSFFTTLLATSSCPMCCGCSCCAAAQDGQCTLRVGRPFCLLDGNLSVCDELCGDHTGVNGVPCDSPPLGPFNVPSCKDCFGSSVNVRGLRSTVHDAPPRPIPRTHTNGVGASCDQQLFCCPCRCCDEAENGQCLAYRTTPLCVAEKNNCGGACSNYVGSDGNVCKAPPFPGKGYPITDCSECQ